MKNKLIVFEGIDGSGKSTLSRALSDKLNKEGIQAVVYEDIEEKDAGFNLLKPFVIDNCSVESSFLFYLSSAIHKSDIIKSLLKERWVICDRYIYSTIVHHVTKGLRKEMADNLVQKLPIRKEDYMFMITIDDALRLQRIDGRVGNTEEDFIKNERGTLPFAKEEMLKTYSPIIIDNSVDGVDEVLEYLFTIVTQ